MSIRYWATTLTALALCIASPARAGLTLPIIVSSVLTGAPTPQAGTMNFPSEPLHTTSPVQAETITVHMSATQDGEPVSVPGAFTTAVASVAVDNAEFAVTGGTCTTGPTNVGLGDGSTCTIDLTFTPAALGTRVANLLVSCAVTEASGEMVITCDPIAPPPPSLKAGPLPQVFIGLRGIGLGGLAAALDVPMMGNGALTLLALLLFAASMVAMRRRG